MKKYHDQQIINDVIEQIKALSENEKEPALSRMRSYYEMAKEDCRHIDNTTAPEEANRRKQCVYYYEDIFDCLGIDYYGRQY